VLHLAQEDGSNLCSIKIGTVYNRLREGFAVLMDFELMQMNLSIL
jgi:hypothetical protein